jgi:hypothetical protein
MWYLCVKVYQSTRVEKKERNVINPLNLMCIFNLQKKWKNEWIIKTEEPLKFIANIAIIVNSE